MRNKIIAVASSSFLKTAIDLLGSIILARSLLPAGIGQVTLIATFGILFIAFTDLGVGQANILLLNAEKVDEKQIFSNTAILSGVLGVVGVFAFILIIKGNEDYFGKLNLMTLIAVAMGLFCSYSLSLTQPILLAKMRVPAVLFLDISISLMTFLAYLYLFFYKKEVITVDFVLIIQSLSKLCAFFLLIYYFKTYWKEWQGFSKRIFFRAIAQGKKLYFSFVVNQMNTFSALFLIKYYLYDLSQVGLYSRAQSLSLLLVIIPFAIGPLLYASWSSDNARARREVGVAFRMSLIFGIIITPLLIMCSAKLIVMVYGESFRSATAVFNILIIGSTMKICSDPIVNYFASVGKAHYAGLANIFGLIALLILSTTLIPIFGLLGASVAFTLSCIAVLSVLLVTLARMNFPMKIMFEFKSTDVNFFRMIRK